MIMVISGMKEREWKTLKVMLYQSGFTRLCCGNKQSLSLHGWPISHSHYMCQMQVGRGLWSLRDPSWWRHPLSICIFSAWLLWKEDLEKLDTCFQQEVTHVNDTCHFCSHFNVQRKSCGHPQLKVHGEEWYYLVPGRWRDSIMTHPLGVSLSEGQRVIAGAALSREIRCLPLESQLQKWESNPVFHKPIPPPWARLLGWSVDPGAKDRFTHHR